MSTLKRVYAWLSAMCDIYPVPAFDVDEYIKALPTR